MLRAVIGDSLLACLHRQVIIDNAKAPGRQSRIQRVERLNRGFIQVAIQSQNRDAVDRGVVQGVLEPTRQKANLLIKQSVTLEIRPDFRL